MFERFDPIARRVVAEARDRAAGNSIDSIHLLVALAAVGGPAADLLENFGVESSGIAEVNRAGAPTAGGGPFAADARRALEHALASCMVSGRDTVTAFDLLVGIMALPGDAPAGRVLIAMGAPADALENAAKEAARGVGEEDPDADDEMYDHRRERGGRDSRKERKAAKALRAFATNLTDLAREGKLDPVVGREREIDQVIITLGRRTKCNPVLVGPAGAGKTAVMEALAQRIAEGTVPEHLTDVEVWAIDVGALSAGTRLRGDFEERVKAIVTAASSPKVVLAIDELHTMMGLGTGSQGGGAAMSDMLKPALSRGELRVIGATTDDEYRIIAKDAAMERRFKPVHIEPFGVEAARLVLEAVAGKYAAHHGVEVTSAALDAAVRLADRYLVDRQLPDSAIDVLDESGALLSVQRGLGRGTQTVIDEAVIHQTVASMTNLAVGELTTDRADRLIALETTLNGTVIGQSEACAAVASAARRAGAGLRDLRRPIANFLFCGPTGVGKTLMATQLAEAFFGDAGALTVFDMSEFGEEHTVAQLLGAPPGYVGHDEGGRLPEAIRRRRGQVLLFDEVEKAHPKVYDALMALLDEGRVTGADGRVADATETVVVMTSNLGTAQLGRPTVGFNTGATGDDRRRREDAVGEALRAFFRPEFLNRIDTTVVFAPLGLDELDVIAGLELAKLDVRLAGIGSGLVVDEGASRVLATVAARDDGARGVRRVITTLVEDPVVDLQLSGALTDGIKALVAPDGQGGVKVSPTADLPDGWETAGEVAYES